VNPKFLTKGFVVIVIVVVW